MIAILLTFPIESFHLQLVRDDLAKENSHSKHGAYIGDVISSVGSCLLAHPSLIPTETCH